MMKKLVSLIMAMAMALTLAVPVMAVDITMEDAGVTGATYSAYKLLDATNAKDSEGNYTLFAYTVNEDYEDILKTVTGKETEEDIVAYIAALNDAGIRAFADAVYAAIKAEGEAFEADAVSINNTFENVGQGYYLIAETELGTNPDGDDTYSLVMLDTAGQENITVETKEDVPTVTKEVEEKNDSTGADSTWGDAADYDIGDSINFVITGTVSDEYASYKSYDYKFSDTMQVGLTYNDDAKVYVVNGENSKVEVTEQFAIVKTDNGFTAYANLKALDALREDVTINANTEIVVEYSATLNDSANHGKLGNTNTVVLYYENDPTVNSDGNPTSDTPPDTAIVFTYDLKVNKVTGTEGNYTDLAGAGFTLYKYIVNDPETGVAVNDWVALKNMTINEAGTKFAFAGLDEGKYKLVETTVPAGYNKADDIIFEVVSTLTEDGKALSTVVAGAVEDTEGEFTVNMTDELTQIETSVVNNTGTELPETGGMGTTLFYALGAVLVIGAGVAMVTKKRMA